MIFLDIIREDMVYWQDMFNRAANKNNEDLSKTQSVLEEEKLKELDKEDKEVFKNLYLKFSKQDFKIKVNENVLNV